MSDKRLFSSLGVLLIEECLEVEFCDIIVNELKTGLMRNDLIIKDNTLRKTYKPKLSNTLTDKILNKFDTNIKPDIEEFFNLKLKTVNPMQTLYYAEGHFFKPHMDDVKVNTETEYKKITVVIFLNDQSKKDNISGYAGGDLKLHGLFIEFPEKALTVPSRKGLMVAFNSDIVHEITTIKSGDRCSLAIWLV